MTYIKLHKASKSFNDALVFQDLELDIDRPGLYIIKGESGCGKSTLLNIIAGFETLSAGSLDKEGSITMIFQNYELIDELSLIDNIFFRSKKSLTKDDQELLHKLGIDEFIKRLPRELSFGQRQRVGIARALAQRPAIVLCDEPTESLDISNKLIVMDMLKDYSQDHIVIIVSHDQELIERYGEVIYEFKDGFHKIKDQTRPKTEFKKENKEKISLGRISFKMSLKKILTSFMVLLVSLTGLWALYSFKKQIFEIPTSDRTINADYIYIKTSELPSVVLGRYGLDTKIILDIDYVTINDKTKRMDVLPYHESDKVEIEGEVNKEGVIINQMVDADIGDEIILEIAGPSDSYFYKAKVTGIVYEPDALCETVYYDLDYLKSVLETVPVEHEFYLNFLELVEGNPSLYESYQGYDKISSFDGDQRVSNSLYDLRQIAHDDAGIFDIIFMGVIVIYAFFIVVFITIFNKRDVKTFSYQAAIINSLGVSLAKLKAYYLSYKAFFILLSLFLATLGAYLLSSEVFISVSYTQFEKIAFLSFLAFVYLYYIISLLILMKDLKRHKMALALKEHEL